MIDVKTRVEILKSENRIDEYLIARKNHVAMKKFNGTCAMMLLMLNENDVMMSTCRHAEHKTQWLTRAADLFTSFYCQHPYVIF